MAYFFLIGLLGSLIGALSGIGGGIIIKPLLDLFSGLDPAQVNFLSGCTVLGMASISLFRRRRALAEMFDALLALLAAGGVVGGLAGQALFASFAQTLGATQLRVTQSAILAVLCVAVIYFTLRKSRFKPLKVKKSVAALAGPALGMLSAFLGIGGGPFNVPVLVLLFAMDGKKASLASIFIIFFAQISGLAHTAAGGLPAVEPAVLAAMVSGGLMGGFSGSSLVKRMSPRQVEIFFCCVTGAVVIISAATIARSLSG